MSWALPSTMAMAPLVAGAGAGTAAVAFLLVDVDDLPDHNFWLLSYVLLDFVTPVY